MTDLELARIVEHHEARVWTDLARAATPEVAVSLGLRTVPIAGGAALIASRVSSVLFNRAIAFGLEQPVDEAVLDRMIGLYGRDVPFSIQPCPHARPESIGEWLDSRGLSSHFNWVRWVRGATPAPEGRPSPRAEAFRRLQLCFRVFCQA